MKQLLMKVVLSLGVVLAAGGGLAASASATPSCAYPMDQGLIGGNPATPLSPNGSSACWTSDGGTPAQTVIGGTPAVVPTTATPAPPATTTAPDGPQPVIPTASAAPIVPASTLLAFTGADVWQTVVIGLILVVGGVVVVRLGRQRRRTA